MTVDVDMVDLADAPSTTTLYLPHISTRNVGCSWTQQARQFEELLVSHPRQERERMTCDRELARLADMRAQWLAKSAVFVHGQASLSVNDWLRDQGYPLLDWYARGDGANNVESMVRHRAPTSFAAQALEFLARSEAHGRHIFGLTKFFRTQELFGVGYARTVGADQFYWVVLTSHRADFVWQ